MSRKTQALVLVAECPRVGELGDTNLSIEGIVRQFRVSSETAQALYAAKVNNQSSCGKAIYSRGLCRSCYNATYYDRSGADNNYEKSSKGRSRAAAYKRSFLPKHKEPKDEINKRMEVPARVSFYEKFGDDPDLSELEPKLKNLVEMYYGLNGQAPHSLEEIGEALGCTKQNVLVLRNRALSMLELQ